MPRSRGSLAGQHVPSPRARYTHVVNVGEAMPQYGAQHIVSLVVIALAAILVVWLARIARDENRVDRALRTAGWALLIVSALWSVYWLLPVHFDIAQSLPLHFSDAMRYLAAIALITRSGWSIAVLYYWGLTLNLQSIITPDLNYLQMPLLEFVMYWLLHGTVLVVPILLAWGLRTTPTWRGYGLGFAATAAWAGAAFLINAAIGTNYAYMNGPPAGTSILDLLGPWPIYIAWEAVLVAGVWALITWPWQGRRRRDRSYPLGRGRFVRRIPFAA